MSLDVLDVFKETSEEQPTETQPYEPIDGKSFVSKDCFEDICERARKMCKSYGLQCIIKSNRIYVKTIFDSWYFDVRCGKTCLMHKGVAAPSTINDGYHVQFKAKLEVEDIITYIKEHTEAKYGNRLIKFSVNVGG